MSHAGDVPKPSAKPKAKKGPTPKPPVDIDQGIPDRASRRPAWKYIVLLVIFLAWVAVLIYMATAGQK